MEKILWRPRELCELLGLSKSKIFAMLAERELPPIYIGRSVRVADTDLQAWLARKRNEGGAEVN